MPKSGIYLFGLVWPPVALDRISSVIFIFYTSRRESVHDNVEYKYGLRSKYQDNWTKVTYVCSVSAPPSNKPYSISQAPLVAYWNKLISVIMKLKRWNLVLFNGRENDDILVLLCWVYHIFVMQDIFSLWRSTIWWIMSSMIFPFKLH